MTARVLVVDDVPANVKLLEARLSAEYFDVVTAMSGSEALAICEKAECDIVLLDVMMPDMDGFEVCRRIKANRATHHIPVVMVTALDAAVRPGEGARCRRRRFPDQAGVRRGADRAGALAVAAQDDDRRAADARADLARDRHPGSREPGDGRRRPRRPRADRRRPRVVGRADVGSACDPAHRGHRNQSERGAVPRRRRRITT